MLGHPVHPTPPTGVRRRERPLDRALAWTGAVLATLPFAATLGLAVVGSLAERRPRFDWLMPAELALLSFAGGAVLWVVALRTGRAALAIGTTAVAAAALLGLTQGAALWTGLAHGTFEPEGWRLAVVLAVYGAFVLASAGLAVEGWWLVRELRRSTTA